MKRAGRVSGLVAVGLLVLGLAGCVPALQNANVVAAGNAFSCATLLDTNTVLCWGDNTYGQLGNGTNVSSAKPVAISGLAAPNVAAGGDSACAVWYESGDSHVSCWGRNQHGQLGNGTTTNSNQPVEVTGLSDDPSRVAVGGGHACVVTASGMVQCWGNNSYGQLGNGTTTSSTVPVTVTGLTSVTSIAAGGGHTCAISSGVVRCWGKNIAGQLGDGTNTDSAVPTAVSGLTTIVTLSLGDNHTCGRRNDGTSACWGSNLYGQLGNGTYTSSNVPIPLSPSLNAYGMAAGGHHTCVVDGTTAKAYCWGLNNFGQLGDGTTVVKRNQPVLVTGPAGKWELGAGESHTCTVDAGHTVRCWGLGTSGQLGNNTSSSSNKPVKVVGP